MRIVIAHSRYRIAGGEESYVERVVPALRRAGHAVETLIVGGAVAPGLGARVRLLGQMMWSGEAARRIEALGRSFRPDVVHAHNLYPHLSPSALLAARRIGAAVVMHLHNARLVCPAGTLYSRGEVCHRCVAPVPTARSVLLPVLRACRESRAEAAAYGLALAAHRVARAFDPVDAFVAPSTFLRELLVEGGVRRERIHVVPNFIDGAVDEADAPPRAEGSERAERAEGDGAPPFVLYAGRVTVEKGVRVLLDAMEGVTRFRLILAGDGPLLDETRERVARRRLAVDVPGRLDQVALARLRARAIAAVVPSLAEENAPFVALEALASGLPIVASARGGLPELVGDAGLLVEGGEAPALRAALERLAGDPGLRAALATKALARAGRYRLDAHLQRLENVYAAAARCSPEEVRVTVRAPLPARAPPPAPKASAYP